MRGLPQTASGGEAVGPLADEQQVQQRLRAAFGGGDGGGGGNGGFKPERVRAGGEAVQQQAVTYEKFILKFLDDRFVAAFDRSAGDSRALQLAYVVRAVTPGTYIHPAAQVEDMYRPQFSARTAAGFVEVRELR